MEGVLEVLKGWVGGSGYRTTFGDFIIPVGYVEVGCDGGAGEISPG